MTEPFDLIVRNGTLVSSAGRRLADIGVRDGRTAAIERPGTLGGSAVHELDAAGRFVLPGLIDGHVHFREPGLEHKEDWLTGSRAAVMGGVTTVLEMPNTIPPTGNIEHARLKARLADEKSYCDFGLFGLLGDQHASQLAALLSSGLVIGLKVFLGPTTGGLAAPADDPLLDGLALARDAQVRVAFHAEDARAIARAEADLCADRRRDPLAHVESRPVETEVRAVQHVGRLLAQSGAGGHILHLSSVEGVRAVDELRATGLDLTCEVSAHHCLLSTDDYPRLGGLVKCNPPVREAVHGTQLLRALAEGRIDCVASDHAPHAPREKLAPDISQAAPGIAGVETTLRLFLTHGVNAGLMALERVVHACSERPAQVWGLWPRKGTIRLGSDADLTIVDLDLAGVIRGPELHGKHGLTPFDGWSTRGAPVATIVRGRLAMVEGKLVAEPGWGRQVST